MRIRIVNALKVFWLCLKNPGAFQNDMARLLVEIFKTIEITKSSSTPIYQKLVIHSTSIEDAETLITMWLSKGVTPVERAIELVEEVKKLKLEIESYKSQL
jgi:hypothetical protein